jgi:hypothetical protein
MGALTTHQVVVDALVELPLERTTLPELVVGVVEALPVVAELLQTVRVDVINPIHRCN